MIALLVWHEDHLSLTDPGKRLGRGLSSPNKAVNGLCKRADTNPHLVGEPDRLKQELEQIAICQA